MSFVTLISGILLGLAAVAAVYRAVAGPSVADRMVAIDTLLFIGVGALALTVIESGDTTYVPVLVVTVLTAFLSTVIVARYIEAETRDR